MRNPLRQAKKIFVIPTKDGKKPTFLGTGGEVHAKIREKMLQILIERKSYSELDELAAEALRQLQLEFTNYRIKDFVNDRPIIFKHSDNILYTFHGTKINRSIDFLFKLLKIEFEYNEHQSSFTLKVPETDVKLLLNLAFEKLKTIDHFIEDALKENPGLIEFSKWGHLLPIKYQCHLLKVKHFDFQGTKDFLENIQLVGYTEQKTNRTMKKEEIEILLLEARAYRDMRNYAAALENLHQIFNAVPDNVVYTYLLASTYLEAQNTVAARLYADKAITIQANYKEAIELLGLINEAEEKFEEAEACYLKCLEIDPDFDNARFLLVQLYSNYFFPKRLNEYQKGHFEFFNVPEKVVEHAHYLLEKNLADIDRLTKKKKIELAKFCLLTFTLLSIALYKLDRYQDCIDSLQKYIRFASSYNKIFSGFFINEETNIFKLYHLLGNEEKKKEYIKIFESYMNQAGNKKESEEHVLSSIAEADKGLVYL